MQLVVANVEFAALRADSGMLSSFKAALREGLAMEAGNGLRPEDVGLELSAGSVRVLARVSAPDNIRLTMMTNLRTSQTVGTTLTTKLSSVDGIDNITTGPIEVLLETEDIPTASTTTAAQPSMTLQQPARDVEGLGASTLTAVVGSLVGVGVALVAALAIACVGYRRGWCARAKAPEREFVESNANVSFMDTWEDNPMREASDGGRSSSAARAAAADGRAPGSKGATAGDLLIGFGTCELRDFGGPQAQAVAPPVPPSPGPAPEVPLFARSASQKKKLMAL